MAISMSASDLEKIGLAAILDTTQFKSGTEVYLEGLRQMEAKTEQASKKMAEDSKKQADEQAKAAEKAAKEQARAAQQAAKDQEQAAKEAARAQEEAAKRSADAWKKVGIAFAAVGAAGVALLAKLTMTAARTEELGVILDVTAENARRLAEEEALAATAEGDQAAAAAAAARAAALNAQAVDEQVMAVKALGITTQAASKTVALLIRYNLDWQRSTELAALAQDAATFAAQDSSEALDGLIHGITTLNPRVLRQYGILVNLEQEYSKFAKEAGIVSTEITDLQKQQIAFNAVMRQAPAIAGAYEAAMGTASKQIRSLSRDVAEVSEEFGSALTPALTSAVGALRDLLKWLRDLPDPVQETAVQALAMATGISTMVGAAALAIPKIRGMITALKELAIVQQLASAGLLGPVGLVAGLVAAAGVAILYANNLEKAKREEAASTTATAKSYDAYIEALDESGISAYALTEALYELVRAQEASGQAAFAQGLVNARENLEGVSLVIDETTGAIERAGKGWERGTDWLSEFDLAVLQDRSSVLLLGTQLGKTGEELNRWANAITAAAEATAKARQEAEDYNRFEGERYKILQQTSQATGQHRAATEDAATATSRYTSALDELSPALQDARLEQEFLNAAQLVGAQIQADLTAEIEANAKEAARATIDAENQAKDDREAARAQLLESQKSLEEDHSKAVSDLLRDLAQVDKDLLADRVKAEQKAVEERIAAYDDLGAALSEADAKLNREREQAHTDYLQKLADLDRKYTQDVEDLNRELARDIEGIEQEHLDKLAKLDADYYSEKAALADEYGQKIAGIEAKYLAEAASIRDRYNLSITKSLAEERDELVQHAKDIAALLAKPWAERTAEEKKATLGGDAALKDELERTKARLDELQAEELAALEERKQAELDELAKWLADEQAVHDKAYQDAITAEQTAYEGRKAERQRQYDERLQDLQIQLGREQEAAQIGRERALADLQTAHAQERAEAERRYRERLAEIDAQLAQEKQRLDEAAEQERAKLGEQLAAEDQSYRDRFAKLEAAHTERLAEIDRALEAEKTEIETKAREATLLYIQEMEGLGPETRKILEQQAQDDLAPAMQKWVDVFVDTRRRAAEQVQGIKDDAARILETGSPSKWAERMAEAIGSGWEQGDSLGPALAAMLDQIRGFKTDANAALQGLKAPQPEQVAEPVTQAAAQATGQAQTQAAPEQAEGPQVRVEVAAPELVTTEAPSKGKPPEPQPVTLDTGGLSDLARLLFAGLEKRTAAAELAGVASVAGVPRVQAQGGEPIIVQAPSLAPPQVSLAAPEVTYQPPALPQMGGATSVVNNQSTNLDFTANYAKAQSEASVRDDLAMVQLMLAARGRF